MRIRFDQIRKETKKDENMRFRKQWVQFIEAAKEVLRRQLERKPRLTHSKWNETEHSRRKISGRERKLLVCVL